VFVDQGLSSASPSDLASFTESLILSADWRKVRKTASGGFDAGGNINLRVKYIKLRMPRNTTLENAV
jgi:hypothetical protein